MGIKHHPLYETWRSMRRRCYDSNQISYPNYGGRGITVCERWRHSFPHFLEDMGDKPTPQHRIDRIDNNGNYEPTNCRWVTVAQNNSNRPFPHNLKPSNDPMRCLIKRSSKWKAQVSLLGKLISKTFANLDDAIEWRNQVEAERMFYWKWGFYG